MKRFLKFFLTLGVAALAFAACEEKEDPGKDQKPAVYTLIGDTAFNNDLKANFKVTADQPVPEDITVSIVLEQSSNFPESNLSYPATLQIAKGSREVSGTVAIKDRLALEAGVEYLAAFAAVVNDVVSVQKVVLKYSRPDLSGTWSAIGTLAGSNWDKDFVMAAGRDGWYSVEGVDVYENSEFKFRKDGDWTVNFGGALADGEFAVAVGGDNIKIATEGVYTLALNPNAEKAKVTRTGDIARSYAFSAPEAFDENLKAVLKFAVDKPLTADITVTLALDTEKSNFPENTLTVPESITIEKGKTEGTAELAIVDKTGYGEFLAVVNATVGGAAVGTVAVKYSNPVPKMTVADIKALCEGKTSNQQFVGDFSGIYVNYVLSGQHFYLEDETGAIRYWTDAPKIKLGDKISGIVSGLCLTDGNGRPQISWLDTTYGKVEAAPADELPKPVTGTLKEFADNFYFNWFRRGVVTDVVLEDNAKKGINVVSDASGTYNVYLNFTPSITVPKGSKVSCIGTFDFDKSSGKNYLKVFSQSEVTGVTPPSAPAL